MATTVSLQNYEESKNYTEMYNEVEALPFMTSPIPVLSVVAAYLSFVLILGPIFMKNRKPFTLRTTLIVYNIIQIAISFYLFQKYTKYILRTGLVYAKCYMDDTETRQEILVNIWLYAFAKLTELLDTIFFVFRKKYNQTSFLHIYHHSIMLTGTWFYLKYTPSDLVTFTGAFNSFVHIFMYTYYALAAIGPHMAKYLTWKKHMTTLQLIQFVCVFFVYLGQIICSECPPPRWIATFIVINNFVFMYLFTKFYYHNYVKGKRTVIIENKTQ